MPAVHPRRAFIRGVWAGGAALSLMGVARLAELVPFPPELIVLRLFELLPVDAFAKVALSLGVWAGWLAFALATLAVLAAAGLVGFAMAAWNRPGAPWLGAAGQSAVLTGLVMLLLFPALGIDPWGRSFPHRLVLPAPVGVWLGTFVYALALQGPRLAVWFIRSQGK